MQADQSTLHCDLHAVFPTAQSRVFRGRIGRASERDAWHFPAILFLVAAIVFHLNAYSISNRVPTSADWIAYTDARVNSDNEISENSLNRIESASGFELRQLAELKDTQPEEAKSYRDWLQRKVRSAFVGGNREIAYRYKNFLTCLKNGNCAALAKNRLNISVEMFEPELSVLWEGIEQPAGTIDWSAGRFGGYGRLHVDDRYWDDELGAYVVTGKLLYSATGGKKKYSSLELQFFSPTSFTGLSSGPCFVGEVASPRKIRIGGRRAG